MPSLNAPKIYLQFLLIILAMSFSTSACTGPAASQENTPPTLQAEPGTTLPVPQANLFPGLPLHLVRETVEAGGYSIQVHAVTLHTETIEVLATLENNTDRSMDLSGALSLYAPDGFRMAPEDMQGALEAGKVLKRKFVYQLPMPLVHEEIRNYRLLYTPFGWSGPVSVFLLVETMPDAPRPPSPRPEDMPGPSTPSNGATPSVYNGITGDPWKMLILIYPNIDTYYVENGVTKHLVASMPTDDLASMRADFEDNLPHQDIIYDYSGHTAEMEAHIVVVDRPLTNLAPIGSGYWPDPDVTRPELNLYAPTGKYDSVIVFWQASDPVSGQSLPTYGWGLGYWPFDYANGMTYATVFNIGWVWPNDLCRGEVFLHEWLHGVSGFYKDHLGFPFNYEDLHGAEEAGYQWDYDQDGCWDMWLRDYMRGLVYENGVRKALVPETWQSGSITTHHIYGWRGEYFANETLSGIPVLVRDDPELNFDWLLDSPHPLVPADHFSARWTRTVYFDGGNYTFDLLRDDGIRLKIDGVTILESWQYGREWVSTTAHLTQGDHTIVVEAYEQDGYASATLQYTALQPDLIFKDGFETGDFSKWSSCVRDSGDLSLSASAKYTGEYGMQAALDDNVPIYCTSDHPNADTRYLARFHFDPNSITMASGDTHVILGGYSGMNQLVMRLQFRKSSGNYQLQASLLKDGTSWSSGNWFTISDASHRIDMDWKASTASGANNGGLTLWVDGVQATNLTGIDNDTRKIDKAQLGAVEGIDTGTRGTYFFDDFESRRTGQMPEFFVLTVDKTGAGKGTIASSPPGIDCGIDCSENYAADTIVTLTALADADSTFTGWSGEGCSGTDPCVVTMTAASSVTANFALIPPPPDLIIQSITSVPATPQINEAVTFSVVIKNQGEGDASSFYVDLFIDTPLPNDCSGAGHLYQRIESLPAGTSQTVTLAHAGFNEAGVYSVNGIIDTNCHIGESNENNNTKSVHLTVSSTPVNTNIYIGETLSGSYYMAPQQSTRQNFVGVNNGPVKIVNTENTSMIAAERLIHKVNGVNTSFTEMMGLPDHQLDTIYWLPWYNNVDLDTQLRFANVSGSTATVHIYVGGVEMPGSPFMLSAGESTRASFAGVNNGPVKITSDVDIVAAERLIYKVNGVNTSFSEMMALPSAQLDTIYWLPWYNNVDLDTQLRFANVSGSNATVHVYVGGVEMPGSPFTLTPGASTRRSFPGVNNGPVKVVSNVNIVAAERLIYNVNGVNTSFTEMMALPNHQLDTTYWLPWYNNKDLDTQLRFASVSNSTATVHVYIGGVEMPGSPFTLAPGVSIRKSFPGVNSGPVQIVSDHDVPIVAAERLIYKVNGANTSFSEMMGLPDKLLAATYWLPWYNNVDLDTQLRFGIP